MLIKVLLLAAIALVVVLGMRAPSGARHLAMRRMALAGFALFAALSVVFPDAWNEAAGVVGVGRGTDLLLYGLIIAFLLSLVTMYRRHREMERRLTLLARRLAIDEAIGRFPPTAPAPPAPTAPPTPPTTTGDDRA